MVRIAKFLAILILTSAVYSVRIEDMKTELEEDVDNMTEA